MAAPELHLVADRLAMRFGSRRLFEGLSFALGPGERFAVLGDNGSGKSTLLRILAGVLAPTSGTVRLSLGGAPVRDDLRPLRVGFAAPALQLYDDLSAAENLQFITRLRGLAEPGARIDQVLARVGLGERRDDRVRAFSTGMRQRLRLATALLPDAPLILLDEPGAALDAAGRELVRSLVAESTAAVVLATNDPAEAALCPRSVRIG